MVRVLLVFLSILLLGPVLSYAEQVSGTYGGEVQGMPVSVTKESDMSFDVGRVPGQGTYTTFTNITPAKFKIVADSDLNVNLTIPNTITLTRTSGTETATVSPNCRQSTTGYVSDSNSGDACSQTASLSASGELYITVFPSSISFDSPNVTGTYTGTVTISVTQ